MSLMMLPWNKDVAWPKFAEKTSDESSHAFEIPEWASRLAGFGHWMVSSGMDGWFYRGVVIVPVRNTAAIWIALGALIASLTDSSAQDIKTGATVWFSPSSGKGKGKFDKGKVGSPIRDGHGLFRIERAKGKSNSWVESCPRSAFFAVEDKPKLDDARSAEKMAAIAGRLGIQCGPEQCLSLANAIQVAGSKERIPSSAEQIKVDDAALSQLMMLGEGSGFSMCRLLGERHAKYDDKARLVIIDGPMGLDILEGEAFKKADTPAVAILTPDEWFSGQPDSDRIANALDDWRGERCEQWPQELEMPGLGCLLYRKDSSR